jgi:hypothetical protein
MWNNLDEGIHSNVYIHDIDEKSKYKARVDELKIQYDKEYAVFIKNHPVLA